MRLLTLADACRDAGLDVEECQSWRSRGYDFPRTPRVVVAHHTASNKDSGNMPSLGILMHGRSDLPGPLCQVGLARNGTVYIIAAGKANHAGPGRWRDYSSSESTVGIEAENNGIGERWPDVQLDAYDRLCAVLLDMLGSTADLLCGHREWAIPQGRKIDPTGIDMRAMRSRVARLLTEGWDVTPADHKAIKEAVRDLLAPIDKRLSKVEKDLKDNTDEAKAVRRLLQPDGGKSIGGELDELRQGVRAVLAHLGADPTK